MVIKSKDRFAFYLFLASLGLLLFAYGVAVGKYRIFPYQIVALAESGFAELRTNKVVGDKLPHGYRHAKKPLRPAIYNSDEACEGVNLVVQFTDERILAAKVMELDGTTLHQWKLDWFEIWPDPKHVPERRVPKSRPGTLVHGIAMMPNGDLVFAFEHLGLVRMDGDGQVVWRLPYPVHHSVHLDEDGTLWVCGEKEHEQPCDRFPNRKPPFEEYTIVEVTPDGKIANEWSVAELLRENGLAGLLYLGDIRSQIRPIGGDMLHLNDVEPFPESLAEGFFEKGDVLVSLRNINTVFAFNRKTRKIKKVWSGLFLRQHDPDFVDGNTFSVFDNNSLPADQNPQSRIVLVSAKQAKAKVFFEGKPETPFYARVAGKHRWLPNGNVLVVETNWGRAFEVTPQGKIVWEYINYVDDETIGWVGDVQRLPREYVSRYLKPKNTANRRAASTTTSIH